ncbi:MAG: DUF6526 family protein [Ignavibacteria bacterium]|nr:DUF6526 family protein [Ignavibacteria bacterium]
MSTQNYQNHKRFVPLFHSVTFPLISILIISSVYYTISEAVHGASLKPGLFLFLISIVLMFILMFSRQFALKAQDRAIRAEENFRHYLLTGKPLDARLTIRQIIGLRFASDAEFPDLCKKAAESGISEDEIKKSIENWRADEYRV